MLELEFKINLDKYCPPNSKFEDLIRKIFRHLDNKPILTKFIDIRLADYRRKRVFLGSDKKEFILKTKVNVLADIFIEKTKIKIREEKPIEEFKIETFESIIAKFRHSYIITDHCNDKWSLDISSYKKCTLESLKTTKELLTKLDNWDHNLLVWDGWEIEVEWIGSEEKIHKIFNKAYLEELYFTFLKIIVPPGIINFKVHDLLKKCAVLLSKKINYSDPRLSMLAILNKAVEPTLDDWNSKYQFLVDNESVLRFKIDGQRQLLILKDSEMFTLDLKNNLQTWQLDFSVDGFYLFDTEFFDGKWYILHAMIMESINWMSQYTDLERLSRLETEITNLGVKLGLVGELLICPYRKFLEFANSKELEEWTSICTLPSDGYILQVGLGYIKWKPANKSTFDFVIVQMPDWLDGKAPFIRSEDGGIPWLLCIGTKRLGLSNLEWFKKYESRWFQYVSISKNEPYVLYPFIPHGFESCCIWTSQPRDNIRNGDIGEFIYDFHKRKFNITRVRRDKQSILKDGTDYGNDWKTVTDIWTKIFKPFDLKYLFTSTVDDEKKEPNKYSIKEILTFVKPKSYLVYDFIPLAKEELELESGGIMYPLEKTQFYFNLKTLTHIPLGKTWNPKTFKMPSKFVGGTELLIMESYNAKNWLLVTSNGMICCKSWISTEGGVQLVGQVDSIEDEWSSTATTGDEVNIWYIYKRMVRGASEMDEKEIIKENPHMTTIEDPNFKYKYWRKKNKDIGGLAHHNSSNLESLRQDQPLGLILCEIEFLLNPRIQSGTKILYQGINLTAIQNLFPNFTFLAEPKFDDDLISYIILSPKVKYQDALDLIKLWEAHQTLMYLSADDMILDKQHRKIIKSESMFFVPYDLSISTLVATYIIGHSLDTWNIISNQFKDEMNTFHKSYRASCFKYQSTIGLIGKYDNCYDCRTYVFVLSKYALVMKITITDAIEKFTQLNLL